MTIVAGDKKKMATDSSDEPVLSVGTAAWISVWSLIETEIKAPKSRKLD